MDKSTIYPIQAQKSFLKFKMDWASIGKMHLSFVSHTGRNGEFKQLDHIEAALPLEVGGGSALCLAGLVLNGEMERRRHASIVKAKESNSAYPVAIFSCVGGSDAKDKRPVMWREVSILPGSKSDYVFRVVEAEGSKNSLGGYVKKPEAQSKTIFVGCSKDDMTALAMQIKACHTAYKVNPKAFVDEEDNRHNAGAVPTNTPAAPVQQNSDPKYAYQVYDMECAFYKTGKTPEVALRLLQQLITKQKAAGWARRSNEEYEAVKKQILSNEPGFFTMNLYKGNESIQLCVLANKYYTSVAEVDAEKE